ncbi:MAG: sulfatase-like hydrolase/transferase [Verrucomicrobiota bacterium]
MTGTSVLVHAAEDKPPNILFIAIDDLNDWIGCLGGHPQTLTPNLDRLAGSGVLFTNAHCPGAACNPSRTAVMTGIAPHRSGLYDNRQKMREILPEAEIIPQHFRHYGYHAIGSGKILHYFVDAPSWDDYFPKAESENPFPRTLYPKERPVSLPVGGPWQYVETDWAALDATDEEFGGDWLVTQWVGEQLRDEQNQPFFLACGIYRPHEPWFVPAKYFEPFPLEDIELPPGYRQDDLDDLPPEGKRRGPNRYFAHIREHGQWRQGIQGYLASIHFADAMLGRVLDALAEGPHLDKTIVVLWSDHGWHLGEKHHWQKYTAWRAVSRVPLIIRVPRGVAPGLLEGTKEGTTCEAPIDLLSLFPTLTELSGIPSHSDSDGPSLVPLLANSDAPWTHIAVTHLSEPGSYGLSTKDWRYIRYAGGGEELYHIAEDPYEWTNLAGKDSHAAKLEELRALAPTVFANKKNESHQATPPEVETSHDTFTLKGWTIHLSKRLQTEEADATQEMLELLRGQLDRVVQSVPEPALSQLREIPIWINPPYPETRGGAEYHPGRAWLERNGRNPEMTRAVEITNVLRFPFENRRMPYLLLHELAHGYHHQILNGGFGNQDIREAFEKAEASGSYEEVDRFDGQRIRKDRAYALTNPMEYFAESSEAYFGKNDFFPFDRKQLKEHDPLMHDLLPQLWQFDVSKPEAP